LGGIRDTGTCADCWESSQGDHFKITESPRDPTDLKGSMRKDGGDGVGEGGVHLTEGGSTF